MKIEDTRGVEENKTGKEEKEERAADDNGSARSWKQEAGRRRGCETRHIGRGRPWCRLWASVGGVGGGGGGGRCHQMPLWRCRRSKISSPKSSTDCSSPASVGAAARTKISRGYNRIFRVTVPCEPRRWNLEWQLCESDRGGRLVWSIDQPTLWDRPFVTGEKNQEEGRGEGKKRKEKRRPWGGSHGQWTEKVEKPSYSSLRLSRKGGRGVWWKERVRSRRGGSRDRATNVHGGGQCDIVRRSRRRRRATGREGKALCERGTREEEEVGQDAGAQEEGAEPRRFLFFFIGGTVPFLSFLSFFFFSCGSNRAFSSEISFLKEISWHGIEGPTLWSFFCRE